MSEYHEVKIPTRTDQKFVLHPVSRYEPYSYEIYTDGTTVYAKNGKTGQIEFSGTDAATVIQNAINALTDGGTVYLKKGLYILSNTINITNHGIHLVGETMWRGTTWSGD
ncbi:MAG: glycosyl hydrolase family 28-related protein, partial [Thermoproteota archaeon]